MFDLLVLGTGSLARQSVYALAPHATRPLTVCIAGRDATAASEVAQLCNMRANTGGAGHRFQSHAFPWNDMAAAAELLQSIRPRAILHASSLQSPWSLQSSASEWSRVVHRGGFGLTLPLQAALLIFLLQAVRQACVAPLIVNACYPDWVNAATQWCDYAVFCGTGNVGILESVVRTEQRLSQDVDLRLIAHHAQLAALQTGSDSPELPSVWAHGQQIEPGLEVWNSLQRIRGKELNVITGSLTASLLVKLLSGQPFAANVPGPMGLPGGYPVHVRGSELSLRLPSGVTREIAVSRNADAGSHDGVRVLPDGTIQFSSAAAEELRRLSKDLPGVLRSEQIPEFADEMLRLREHLS